MTKVSVEEISPIERRIKVEVESEIIARELDMAYRLVSHRARIPGFRPGKVPRRILESRFRDQVESDVIKRVVEDTYKEAVATQNLVPVDAPRVTTDEGLKAGEPFRYQAQVEVRPTVTPTDYVGLPLTRATTEITDAQLDEELERLRQSMAELVPAEGRALQLGDFAMIDHEGTVDGEPFPGSQREDAMVEVIPGEVVDGNMLQLEGMQIGEERTFDYTFPADYQLETLAGKTATFKVQLKGVKARIVPELNDELAKAAGAGETLDELKTRIRKELVERAEQSATFKAREELLTKLVEKNAFDVPRAMIERAIDSMLETALDRFRRQGIDARQLNLDLARLREDFRERAILEVKGGLLLDAIATKEGITATAEDLDARIKDLAEKNDMPVERIRGFFQGPELGRQLREEKTIEFLTSKANVSEA